jgi:hypothetical protein
MMDRSPGSFWLDLQLHHPTLASSAITHELHIEPAIALDVGRILGPITQKSTFWSAVFWESSSEEALEQALKAFTVFLEAHSGFFERVAQGGGDITLQMNQSVAAGEGTVFDLWVECLFLKTLAAHDVSLKIQAWM